MKIERFTSKTEEFKHRLRPNCTSETWIEMVAWMNEHRVHSRANSTWFCFSYPEDADAFVKKFENECQDVSGETGPTTKWQNMGFDAEPPTVEEMAASNEAALKHLEEHAKKNPQGVDSETHKA